MEAQAARIRQLGELVVDGPADARQLRRLAAAVGLDDRHRGVGEGIGRPSVCLGLEDDLALELDQVADLAGRWPPARRSRAPARRRRGRRSVARPARRRQRRCLRRLASAMASVWRSGARFRASPPRSSASACRQAASSSTTTPIAASPLGRVERVVGAPDEGGDRLARAASPTATPTETEIGRPSVTPRSRVSRLADRRADAQRHVARLLESSHDGAGRRTPRHRSAPACPPPGHRPRWTAATATGRCRRRHGRYVSLMRLKWSMSIISTPSASPARRPRVRSSASSSKWPSIGQAGQGVDARSGLRGLLCGCPIERQRQLGRRGLEQVTLGVRPGPIRASRQEQGTERPARGLERPGDDVAQAEVRADARHEPSDRIVGTRPRHQQVAGQPGRRQRRPLRSRSSSTASMSRSPGVLPRDDDVVGARRTAQRIDDRRLDGLRATSSARGPGAAGGRSRRRLELARRDALLGRAAGRDSAAATSSRPRQR